MSDLILMVKKYAHPLSFSWHWEQAISNDMDYMLARNPDAEFAYFMRIPAADSDFDRTAAKRLVL